MNRLSRPASDLSFRLQRRVPFDWRDCRNFWYLYFTSLMCFEFQNVLSDATTALLMPRSTPRNDVGWSFTTGSAISMLRNAMTLSFLTLSTAAFTVKNMYFLK